ncbi:chain length determinant protein [Pontibacter sp. BT310]|uniref:Chain length determinant protein n=1 Tax=Pontibacter populi TaxID=890055 RepID=A0ABS6XBN3_9BACT|nr:MULTISPECIES: chain length determinant protein [Pontibacter]MBJ6118422.1 chain length determinant protein [Pontibacter sp. BT310]MBR0570850.1 hypothetical protein [Microvirga sp. STS03]MBW3365276.1 chain length determinant protein [Pontibacter populi]
METKEDQDIKRIMMEKDEIDLSYIINKINRLFTYIGRGLVNFKLFIFRNTKLISLISLMGVLVGYFAFENTKPYYTSSMTLVLADFRNQFVEDHLNKISLLVKDDNYEALSERLKIPIEEAQQIKKMSFSNLDEARISEDSVLTGSPFRIELMLYNKGLFDDMEESITEYLESNRYFSKQKRIRQRELEGLIGKYKQDIASIDSVKIAVANLRGPANGFVYGEPLDPTNLYKESVNMYQQQAHLESELERLENVQVVVGFAPQSKPAWPILPIFLAAGALAGFIIALIVAQMFDSKKKIKV